MELSNFLLDVAADLRSGLEAQRLARRLLKQWNSGLVPSLKEVKALRGMLKRPETCGRLEADGSCAWLRKHAKSERIRLPAPGQRVYCRRRATGKAGSTLHECAGYMEPKK